MGKDYQHQTVLINEAVEALNLKADGCYIDATYGRGGHSQKILQGLGSKGRLIVIDKDPQAVADAREKQRHDDRIIVWQGSFKDFPQALENAGISAGADGLLLDLGVSSPQLDDASRGFSFMRDGALDMRMDPDSGQSAADWLNAADEAEMADVLWKYGEEKFSRRIARKIVEHRAGQKMVTTKQLADLIAATVPKREPGKHPATRSFQAIRIAINGELDDLDECLHHSLEYLAPHGRLVVISFHSLEDRMVKQFLSMQQRGPKLPKGLPVMSDHYIPKMRIVGKAIKPGQAEVDANPRARSAIMRIGERTA